MRGSGSGGPPRRKPVVVALAFMATLWLVATLYHYANLDLHHSASGAAAHDALDLDGLADTLHAYETRLRTVGARIQRSREESEALRTGLTDLLETRLQALEHNVGIDSHAAAAADLHSAVAAPAASAAPQPPKPSDPSIAGPPPMAPLPGAVAPPPGLPAAPAPQASQGTPSPPLVPPPPRRNISDSLRLQRVDAWTQRPDADLAGSPLADPNIAAIPGPPPAAPQVGPVALAPGTAWTPPPLEEPLLKVLRARANDWGVQDTRARNDWNTAQKYTPYDCNKVRHRLLLRSSCAHAWWVMPCSRAADHP
jgi:hypothetical protein